MDKLKPKKYHPIPSHAKSVFSGLRWEVLQWEQEQFDGSKKTYESVKRCNTVSIIPVLDNGKIIILEEKQPHWDKTQISMVGGGIEEGEEIFKAAQRELFEETGIIFKNLHLVAIEQPIPGIDYTHYTFVAKNIIEKKEISPDAGEMLSPFEISFENLIDLVRQRKFFYKPHLIEEFLLADKIENLFEMLQEPHKYELKTENSKS